MSDTVRRTAIAVVACCSFVLTLAGSAVGVGPGAQESSAINASDTSTAGAVVRGASASVVNNPGLTARSGGEWEVVGTLPAGFNNVHLASTPSGRSLILIAGSGNNRSRFAAGTFESYWYQLSTGAFSRIPTPTDLFCSGHAYVRNSLLVMGGTAAYDTPEHDFIGARHAYLLDPVTRRYTAVQDMADGRWYPAAVRTGAGSVVVTSGFGSDGLQNRTTEVYEPGTRTWTMMSGETRWGGLYPNLFLNHDGKLFYSGGHTFGTGNSPPTLWDYTTNAFTPVEGDSDTPHRDQAAAFMVGAANDWRVVIAGGGNGADKTTVASTAYIDLKEATPRWQAGPSLAHAKMYVLAVTLPNEQTLITGGASRPRTAGTSVLEAELMDPSGTQLTLVNAPTVPRAYHSAAALAYDGSVYVVGGNPPGVRAERRIERYLPPYMFADDPPRITGLSSRVVNSGDTLTVATRSEHAITSVKFVAPMATTHSYDSNQRVVRADIVAQTATSVEVSVPADRNLMPPGPWMVFVTDDRNVPNRNAASVTLRD
jgi:hypothetical protein